MAKSELFENWLSNGKPILADGAIGTMLHARGIGFDTCFDELSLRQPAVVGDIHRAYIEAQAQVIETNTFGANRYKLAEHGLERQVRDINAAGVEIARRTVQASFRDVLIAGSVGPLGVRLAPFGRVKPEQAYSAFREQIEALVESGADLIVIETQSDLHEVREAVRAARSVTDRPVVASVTFTRDNSTLLGDAPARVAQELAGMGADLIGANCSVGPSQLLRILRIMRQAAPEARFSVMPNAGWPERVGGRIMYPASAEYFGQYAVELVAAGASLVGGCCGTTPAHIAAMREGLDHPERYRRVEGSVSVSAAAPEPAAPAERPTRLASYLGERRFVVAVEMSPPRGFSTHKLLAGAHLLAESGADVIDVADSPMARMRMSPWAACQLIQNEVGIESVLHFPTRGRNLLRVQGDLLAAHALNVRNVFVVMGDPSAVGDYPEAMDNYDLVPTGLIKLIKHRFNAGFDHSGAQIGGATSFFTGAALNLGGAEPERELKLLKKKIEAGADFLLTQPVYEPERARAFLGRYEAEYGKLPVPLLVGVLPLFSERHASFLHNEVPGIQVPEELQRRIAAAGEKAPEEGVRIAIELVETLREIARGVYLVPAFSRYDLAAEIIEAVRKKTPTGASP